ncbi:MAG TPA: hypothetical protein VN626_03395 [Clostridia bacterium]|nr:hypothetical protein [Clostridia bacterium]
MRLIHTLLFLCRENKRLEDFSMIETCLKSLEKSTYKTVVVYNQGCLSNDELQTYLKGFALDFYVLGDGTNTGTTIGRQACFRYIWENFPGTDYISEIHPDMIFSPHWEDALVTYLESHDEPMISCAIVDHAGNMPFINKMATLPASLDEYADFLEVLREDTVHQGFTVPCIHVSKVLQQTGGYDPAFLTGKQCFEDDSMLLGYYYYYGTRADWHPKVYCGSVVYHAVAGQRMGLGGNVMVNFNGLVRQYGAVGLKNLSDLHTSSWHKRFFKQQYDIFAKH